ncbi:MAG: DUF1573 domain-containing protein [Planctomycetaceae bacterium]|nr:DUF1573 domain-containing protein [Planctomycetaceae bacterium]
MSGLLLFFAFFVILKDVIWFDTTLSPRSHLVFTPSTVQLGSISPGSVTGKAVITNMSHKSVTIDSVTKTCDCAQVLLGRGILLPGASREISFQWDTRGKRGHNETSIGIIYFTEKDTTQRVAILVLEATVVPDFEVIPSKLVFLSDEQKSVSFSLKAVGQHDVQIKDAMINHPAFTTIVTEDGMTVTVSFEPELWLDNVRNLAVQMLTSSSNEPIFQVPINIIVANN